MTSLPARSTWLGRLLILSLLTPIVAGAQITWNETTGLPGTDHRSVWASSPTSVVAAGGFRTLNGFDGSSWAALSHPAGANRYVVYGTSATELYSAGQAGVGSGNLMRYNGSVWSTVFTSPQSELIDVWADGAGQVFTVGDGRFFHYNGAVWSEVATGLSTGFNVNRLQAVWGASANDVFAAGRDGYVARWNGSALAVTQPFGGGFTINDIHGLGANAVYAVGNGGRAYRYDGSSWTALTTGTSLDLFGVFALSNNRVLVSGADGALFMVDGTSFVPLSSGTNRALLGIHGIRDGNTDYWWIAASNARGEGAALLSGVEIHADPAVVPEPATVTLLATGLAGIAAAKRRRRMLH